jgi:hypothetical protein
MNKYNVSQGKGDVSNLGLFDRGVLLCAMERQASLVSPVFELTEREAEIMRKAGYILWIIQSESED